MKRLIFLFWCIWGPSYGQVVSVPDIKFLQALTTVGVDANHDGLIQVSEASNTIRLDLSTMSGITDATGIEAFVNLDSLNISNQQLTSINISSLTKLTAFIGMINRLTALDVSQNPQLKYVFVGNNKLTSLDVSSCPKLQHLECSFNRLTSLTLGNNTVLSTLECTSNKISTLEVTQTPALVTVYCNVNSITGLDFTLCKNVVTIDCGYNLLTSLNTQGCTQLKRLICYNNRLTALDLSTNTQLTNLDIGRNFYPTLDLSKNTLLQSLDCADSPNLTKVCVVDSVAYNANPTNYFKDVSTTFIQECALLTSWDSEKVNSAKMEVYPNPSISSFRLNNSLGDALHIFNAHGVLVESFYSPLPSEFGQNYPRGIYCAQYQNLGNTTKISLVKE